MLMYGINTNVGVAILETIVSTGTRAALASNSSRGNKFTPTDGEKLNVSEINI